MDCFWIGERWFLWALGQLDGLCVDYSIPFFSISDYVYGHLGHLCNFPFCLGLFNKLNFFSKINRGEFSQIDQSKLFGSGSWHLFALSVFLFILQNLLNPGGGKRRGKTSFVEHRSFLHLYHSFHRLWIFLVMMFQVCNLSQLFI